MKSVRRIHNQRERKGMEETKKHKLDKKGTGEDGREREKQGTCEKNFE